MTRYEVEEARDDTGHLRSILDRISGQGGRVINVVWQPSRTDGVETRKAGYTIIFERDVEKIRKVA